MATDAIGFSLMVDSRLSSVVQICRPAAFDTVEARFCSCAYYAIFAMATLILISIHIASLFFDRTSAIGGLTNELSSVVGRAGSDAIKQMLDAAGTAQPRVIATAAVS